MMKKTFIALEETVSTNAFLLEMPEGERMDKVVSARVQTAGKGMGTNIWESEAGKNLTFSMGADMFFLKATDQFLLSQAVPLGLFDVLDTLLPSGQLAVKWPNDLYFGNRKLCGILINSTIHGMDMGTSVIGIGLNVNQVHFQNWPTNPISMKMILGRDTDLEPLLKDLVVAVDQRIQQLRSPDGTAEIKADYLKHLYRYRQWGSFETKKGVVKLYIDGIDKFGRLIALNESRDSQVFDIKELRFL